MSETTAPVIAIGAITIVNRSVFNGQPFDWKVPIATAVSVGLFSLGEKAMPEMFKALAWLALGAVVLSRVDPTVPAPAESALKWFNKLP